MSKQLEQEILTCCIEPLNRLDDIVLKLNNRDFKHYRELFIFFKAMKDKYGNLTDTIITEHLFDLESDKMQYFEVMACTEVSDNNLDNNIQALLESNLKTDIELANADKNFKKLKELLNKDISINSDKLIFSKQEMTESLDTYYKEGGEKSESTGWRNLDEYWTVGKSQLTVVTGIPGSGKSNFMDALSVNLAYGAKWKWSIFSPENMPISRVLRSLVEKYLEKPMFLSNNTRGFTKEKYTEVLNDFIYPHFNFVNPFTVDRKLETVLSAIRQNAEGVDGVIIDPWNEIEHTRPHGMTETEYIGMSLMKMKDEAVKHNVHLFIVAHPTKLKKDDDGKYQIATPYDISGSANWWNKPDNCLSVYRDFGNDKIYIGVQKIRIRDFGKIGKAELTYIKGSAHYEDASIPH